MSDLLTADEPRDRRVIAAVAVLIAVLIGGLPLTIWLLTARSSASFSDTEILDNNRLGAATLDIELGSEEAVFDARGLAPGDEVSGHLEVTNVGELPVELSVSATSSGGPLGDWLRFSVWTSADQCRPDDVSAGRAVLVAEDFAITGAGTGILGTAGDGITLSMQDTVVLCLGARLPLEAGNEAQGQSVAVNLIIDAVHDVEASDR